MFQPGAGYRFTRTAAGTSLDATEPFINDNFGALRLHPFKISLLKEDDAYLITVEPGTLNNLPAQAFAAGQMLTDIPKPQGTLVFNDAGESFVYLMSGPSDPQDEETEPEYPDPDTAQGGYPIVLIKNERQTSDDTLGWILLGKVTIDSDNNVTVIQYVKGSLWGEYFKCGESPAKYWFASV